MFGRKFRDNEAMAMRLAALAELPGIDLVVDGPGAQARRERAMFFGVAFAPIDIAGLGAEIGAEQAPRARVVRSPFRLMAGRMAVRLRRVAERLSQVPSRRPAPGGA